MINAPKGTEDVLPNDSFKWQYIENKFSEICSKYGFKEIRTPMFENTDLFNRSIGETTDIVTKEMYTFNDQKGRSITLKPEGTSPVVRAFIQSGSQREMQPIKYFYDTPCFRYEKPQAGRLREFHQFGVETFGSNSMMADAEIIALAKEFLNAMGLKNIKLMINSVGCNKCRPAYREKLKEYLKSNYDSLCDNCKKRYEKNPMRVLDCKDENCKSISKNAPKMIDYLCDECRDAFSELKENLKLFKIDFNVDTGIVRGLDYYTKTAFEFITDEIGAQGTICGGGRYDHLIEEIGGIDIPGVGFGLGKERLLLLMKSQNATIQYNKKTFFVAFTGDDTKENAINLIVKLRNNGMNAIFDTKERNLKGQMKYADRANADYTIIIGEDEIKSGFVTLRNMKDKNEKRLTIDDLIERFK